MYTLQLSEVLQQPQNVSRDSEYTSPSPMVGNVSAEDNQKLCHKLFCFLMCRDAVIKTNLQCLCGEGKTIFTYQATKQSSLTIFTFLHWGISGDSDNIECTFLKAWKVGIWSVNMGLILYINIEYKWICLIMFFIIYDELY
jgi:hypothetical protein